LPEDGLPPAPGSLTQLLGGKSKTPSPPPTDRLDPPRTAVPNPPDPRSASSFTSAFDGVNAFTRNPADLGETNFPPAAERQPRPDVTPSASPGSFTRLFGSGEGILTPTGDEQRPRPPMARDPRPAGGGLPSFPQAESAPDRNAPSKPAEIEPGSFTQAFHSQSAPEPPESKTQRGSFTEEFGPSPSWPAPETLPHSTGPLRTYPPRPGGTSPTYNTEPSVPLSNPQRPPAPAGGFTRLIDTLRPDPAPPSDPPSMRSARPPEHPLPDLNFTPRGPASEGGATVVFNPSSQPEPEVAAPRGKSEYTVVVERSRLRQAAEGPGAGASPYGAGAPAAPPNPPQYPQFAQPAAPAWQPPPAPAPPWQPPQMTAPPMQAPALGAPALPLQPPSLGDKLVSFLPFMLALTVINFLGLLAVLIILFATRK